MSETEHSPTPTESGSSPELRCLGGAQAPVDMGVDLRRLVAFDVPPREQFWLVLRAYLRPELDDEAERVITGYCDEHGLTPAELAAPVKATRHLFREGARYDATHEDLAADIMALVDIEDAQTLVGLLLPWYEDLLPLLRRQLIRQTVSDHGKVVVETRWRLERIVASDRARGLDTPVAVVTFSYLDGKEERRTTLHFLPDQLAALQAATTEMLA
jgi:hypothetical protein